MAVWRPAILRQTLHVTQTRNLLSSVVKAAISLAVIGFIAWHIDRSMLAANWHKLSLASIGGLLGVLALQMGAIVALRLRLVLAGLTVERPLAAIWRVAISGSFVEQIALGFVGGDAVRLWLLHRLELPMKTALAAIVVDRFLGCAALLLLAMAGISGLLAILPKADQQIIVLVGGAGLVVFVVAVAIVGWFSSLSRHLASLVAWAANELKNPRFRLCVLAVFCLALLTQVTNVFVFYLVGRDLDIQLGLSDWFLIAPPALLLAMLPITAGGWGLREASLIVALAPLGVAPETAVIPSIVFGLGALLVTLPGGVVLLLNQREARAAKDGEDARPQFSSDHGVSAPLAGSPASLLSDPFSDR